MNIPSASSRQQDKNKLYHWPDFTPPQPQNAAASVAYFVTAVNSGAGRGDAGNTQRKPDGAGGGAANAQVGGRTVQMVESRPELGVRKTLQLNNNVGPLTLDGRAGWLHRSALGDDTVRLTMIDQTKLVATEMGDRSAAFVGAALSIDLPHDVTFKLHSEAVFGDGMTSFDGLAMFSAKF